LSESGFTGFKDLQDLPLKYDILNIDLMINSEGARVKIELPEKVPYHHQNIHHAAYMIRRQTERIVRIARMTVSIVLCLRPDDFFPLPLFSSRVKNQLAQ
jgi:hypothetical protein